MSTTQIVTEEIAELTGIQAENRAKLDGILAGRDGEECPGCLEHEIVRDMLNSRIDIGAAWMLQLHLALEAGADLKAACRSALTGALRDEATAVAMLTAKGYDGRNGHYENCNKMAFQLMTEADDDDCSRIYIKFAIRILFIDLARKSLGEHTAEVAWDELLGEAEDSADYFDEALHVSQRVSRVGMARTPVLDFDFVPDIIASMNLDELAAMASAAPLLSGLVNADSVTYLVGEFGTYKTFTLIGWALAVASGESWCGHKAPAAMPVLYVAAEGHAGLRERFVASMGGLGIARPENLYIYTEPLRLGRADSVALLIHEIKRTGARMVILDTLHKVAAGLDTNGDGGAGVVAEALERIKASAGVAVVLAHHTGYGGQHARGSSALEDDADMVWLIQKSGGSRTEEPTRILTQRKNREGALVGPRSLVFNELGRSGYVTLDVVDERLSVDELVDLLDDEGLVDTASQRTCEGVLSDRGVKYNRLDLRTAVAIRKGRTE